MEKHTKNKTTRFLKISIVSTALLCVVVFLCVGKYMNKKSEETMHGLGDLYMTGISDQIVNHFETLVGLRLSQVTALVKTLPPGSMDEEELREQLCSSARARGFNYLAYYSTDGDFEMLYGEELTVVDPEPFLASLNNDESKVAVGVDASGNKLVLFGVSSEYPMSEEETCTALVTALPVEYISNTLSLEEDDSLAYSHILRRDGSYVIRGSSTKQDSYLDRLREKYGDEDEQATEEYIGELTEAMKKDEVYSAEFQVSGHRRQIYGTKLPYSEWYLVTILPYGELDESVDKLSAQRSGATMIGCLIILAAILFVFILYFRLIKQQTKEIEEARTEAVQANRAKSEFLSNMSHDIRTPMNAIVGMTAIATANIDNKEQVENCLKKITLSSKHLLGLINDVLDMSKIESGKMTLNVDQVSLRELVNGIVGIVQPQVRAKRQSFDVLIHDITYENVCCDSVRLNQVLLNFLSNAVKFTPEEGKITLSIYEEASPKGNAYVRTHIKVRDNGIGMSPEFLEQIYDSYTREDSVRVKRTEGAGLGMAITKYIVDAMQGTIDVQSAPGKGSCFCVTLDLKKASVEADDMRLPECRMLLVDDDELLCKTTVETLRSIGVDADWVSDGESAVRMLEAHQDENDAYRIILLDWKMPGMDGIQTAQEIGRRLGQDVPILLISAYDWSEIEEEARSVGISGFISKPLFKSTLYYGLRKYLGVRELPQEEESRTDMTGVRVLMAEDNSLNWEIANELLSVYGMELDWAENGQVCVDKFNLSPEGYYNAILMDVRMPVMNGYEATRAVRAMSRTDANIPIIAMTADAFAEDIQKCLDSGMNAHIAKPIEIKDVVRVLQKYLQ